MKFATKPIRHYPPHPNFSRYSSDMDENANKLQFKFTAFNSSMHIFSRYRRKCYQILIFSVFKIWSLSPYRLQIKFSMSMLFYLFTIVINFWLQKFVTVDVITVFVNNQQLQHGIQRRGKDFDKKFVFKEVHSKEVDRRIS